MGEVSEGISLEELAQRLAILNEKPIELSASFVLADEKYSRRSVTYDGELQIWADAERGHYRISSKDTAFQAVLNSKRGARWQVVAGKRDSADFAWEGRPFLAIATTFGRCAEARLYLTNGSA